MNTLPNKDKISKSIDFSKNSRIKKDKSSSSLKSRSNLAEIVCLSMQDYNKIKSNTKFTNENIKPLIRDEFHEKHKNKLIEYDKNKKLNFHQEKPSDIEMENINKKNNILKMARNKLDEEIDLVKEMNKIMLYSKVQTIRDRQLQESKKINDINKEQDNKMDILMEIERLKELQYFEDREIYKKDTQKKGALVIIDQIKEREIGRNKQKEELEKEKQKMLNYVKSIENSDKNLFEQTKFQKEKLIKENQEANRKSIELKQKKKQDEKDLEIKLLQYLNEKEKKEEMDTMEKKRIKEEKEKEVQKLRKRQEKAHDKISDLNSFRAKRSFEESERKLRNKEIKEMETRKKRIEEFVSYNQKQKQNKELVLAEQAQISEVEFKKIVERQIEEKLEEEKKIIEKKKLLVEHNLELRRQIKEREEIERLKIRESVEEGRKIKQKNIIDSFKLEDLRKDKIKQLLDMKVPEKYIVDLEKLKINY